MPSNPETILQLKREARIARYLSRMAGVYLHSVGPIPERLNRLFLRWVNGGKLPKSIREINEAMRG